MASQQGNLEVKLTKQFLNDLVELDSSQLRFKVLESITKDGNFIKHDNDHRLSGEFKQYNVWIKWVKRTSSTGSVRLIYFQKGSIVYFWRILTDHDYESLQRGSRIKNAYSNLENTTALGGSLSSTTNSGDFLLAFTADTLNSKKKLKKKFRDYGWLDSETYLSKEIDPKSENRYSEIYLISPYIGDILNPNETIGKKLDNNIENGSSVTLITLPPEIQSETRQRKKLLEKYRRTNFTRKERKIKDIWKKIQSKFKVSDPNNLKRCKHIGAVNPVVQDKMSVNLCKNCKLRYTEEESLKNIRLEADLVTQERFFRSLRNYDAQVSGKMTDRQRLDDLRSRGFNIYFHKNLHSKIYYIEQGNRELYPKCYIGSGNLSTKGIKQGNMEMGYTFSTTDAYKVKEYIEFLMGQSQTMEVFFNQNENDLIEEIVDKEVNRIHYEGRRIPGKSVDNLVAIAVRGYYRHMAKRASLQYDGEDEREKQKEKYLKEKEYYAREILLEKYTIEKNEYFSIV